MKARRVLGAATAALLTGTMLGAAPTAVAGDNDRSDWTGTRALKFEEDDSEGVRLVTARNRWALVAREVSQPVDAPELWRLRERARDGQWGRPLNLPSEVNNFRFATNRNGWTIGAYVADGKVWGVLHTPSGRTASTKELGPEVAGAGSPYPMTTDVRNGDGLIVYGGKHYRHLPATGGQDTYVPPRWETAEDPDPDHGTADFVTYAFTWDYNLLAFWQPRNTDNLMVSKQVATPTGPVWTPPRNLGSGEFFQAYKQAAAGDRLITTNAADGVTLWDYQTTTQDPATFDFTNRRSLSGPTAGNGSVSPIYALVDRLGTLTVGWREPRVDQGDLVLWQTTGRRARTSSGRRSSAAPVTASSASSCRRAATSASSCSRMRVVGRRSR